MTKNLWKRSILTGYGNEPSTEHTNNDFIYLPIPEYNEYQQLPSKHTKRCARTCSFSMFQWTQKEASLLVSEIECKSLVPSDLSSYCLPILCPNSTRFR